MIRRQYGEPSLTAAQSKAARAALGWEVRQVAAAAQLAPDTISCFERGDVLGHRTIAAIRAALEAAGVEFTKEDAPRVRRRKDQL